MMFNISGQLHTLWSATLSNVFKPDMEQTRVQIGLHDRIKGITKAARTRGRTTDGSAGARGRSSDPRPTEALESLSFSDVRPAVSYIVDIDDVDNNDVCWTRLGALHVYRTDTHTHTGPRDYRVLWTVAHPW